MRIMISGGGTGGHVYPALSALPALKTKHPSAEVLWVGSEDGMEGDLLRQAGVPFVGISAGGLRGKSPIEAMKGVFKLGQGWLESRRILADFRPDVLLVTGGYVCVPMSLAAWMKRVPIVIYLPDIQPGQAIRYLSYLAHKIAVTAPPAQAFFKEGQTVVTGYPVRQELFEGDRSQARQHFNLSPDLPTVLVFGGSRGARSINQTIVQNLHHILAEAQLIHISGTLDAEWTQGIWHSLHPQFKERYHLYAYLHEDMTAALLAADVVISRAGASILGEFPAVGLPAILIPYPYSGAHQVPNAQYLVSHGAGLMIADENLEQDLLPTLFDLLHHTAKRLQMGQQARSLARPNASFHLVQVLEETTHVRRTQH